jgi:uncharacterized protein
VKKLVLVARRRERLDALAAELCAARPGLEVEVRSCDLGDRAALERLADELVAAGGVDILVNNAGLGNIGMFDLSDWRNNEQMIEVNVRALTYLTHRLVGPMLARGRGGILNISSGFGLAFLPGFGVYAATKHYVTALSEVLRLELGPVGIVVTQVCPGPVATEFEQVAGNFTGQNAGPVQISAEECARTALKAFERGRALVVPGKAIRTLMWLDALAPRGLKRLVLRPGASWLRGRQITARSETR